ncbi:AAA+ family ATPase [Maritimibacter sp. UBA3975]|uniref:AAA+ family ATPase n=1 Tax=Maritimibacter sp. UBA3975 TaxID=1946833 RepID=UPI000C0AF9F2|nr:AAA+ family ATPase [Maritimibacter sp. UBA3975]MAM62650.1 AAA+ family ATPase [Maritimibacter sp.]|tara:strand:- start:2174 stop:2473 length:300 start_codon:yes stop_codon:yes gene_type:complete
MTRILPLTIAALLLAAPVAAQEDESNPQLREGAEMMSEAFRLLLDGLSKEVEPLTEAWRDMLKDLEELPEYEKPEMLPNGDIIIRRKVPLEEAPEGTDI